MHDKCLNEHWRSSYYFNVSREKRVDAFEKDLFKFAVVLSNGNSSYDGDTETYNKSGYRTCKSHNKSVFGAV